jgi:flagellar biosynthesis component FlhA
MSVAEQTAVPNLSNILGKLHWIFSLEVMGVLMVMAAYNLAMTSDLLISLETTLSIIIMLVSVCMLQPVYLSRFPSLLLTLAGFPLVVWTRLILLQKTPKGSAAGHEVQALGPSDISGKCAAGIILFLALIVIYSNHINHGSLRIAEFTPGVPPVRTTDLCLTQRKARNQGPLSATGKGPTTDFVCRQKTIWIQG